MLIEHIERMISPYTLNEVGKAEAKKLVQKYKMEEIIEALNKGRNAYLRYGEDGQLVNESVEQFLSKIPGIIVISRKGPIYAKIHYAKGICKNRFYYWDDAKGIGLLKELVRVLEEKGLEEDRIVSFFETEVFRISKSVRNWTIWHTTIESWIDGLASYSGDETDNSRGI